MNCTPEVGSAFTLQLPLTPVLESAERRKATNCRFLVVDDELPPAACSPGSSASK